MDNYRSYIHASRYARFLPEEGRRETHEETVSRYIQFFKDRANKKQLNEVPWDELEEAILHHEIMPSMRAMMTAGDALERDAVAGYNCSFVAVDNPRVFDEILYVLMCFHPDTEVVTVDGNKKISRLKIGDRVLSFDEEKEEFTWEEVLNVVENPTKDKQKLKLQFDNGSEIHCTHDHQFLTKNRGWVESRHLTYEDDIVSPEFMIYRVTNQENGQSYIGYTSKSSEERFGEHLAESTNIKFSSYNTHFHRALRKYNKQDWMVETIDFAYTLREALDKEVDLIKEYDTKNKGYNSTDGGEGTSGYTWTEEQRKQASDNAYTRMEGHREGLRQTIREKSHPKIHAIRKTEKYREEQRERNLGENNPRYGKNHTKKWREEASERNRGEGNPFYGRKHTKETKEKMSRNRKGKAAGRNNPFYGKKHTEETKSKMRKYWQQQGKQKQDKERNNETGS